MANNVRMNSRYPSMPKGTEVASYRDYQEAVQAVESLGDAEFPLSAVSIVGSDLHIVESVVGKLTPARVAVSGAGQGLTWGLLMGLMAMLLIQDVPAIVPMLAIVGGVVAGVLLAIVSWSIGRKSRKGFAAQSQLVATRYAILVSEQTDQAFKLLQRTSGNSLNRPKTRVRRTGSDSKRPEKTGPTEFGSRSDEAPKFGVRLESNQRTKVARPIEQTENSTGSLLSQPDSGEEVNLSTETPLSGNESQTTQSDKPVDK